MTIQKQLAQIVAVAQAEVECPGACLTPSGLGTVHGIGLCPCGGKQPPFGTGKVPDPRYASLVEALAEPCPSCIRQAMSGDDSINTHMAGCIKGRVLRLKWQQGELARVLLDWADKHVPYEPAKSSPQLHTALVLCFREPDTNERATQVFVKFMEATHATEGEGGCAQG